MYIAILGRQPALGLAELERMYGASQTKRYSEQSALIDAASFDFNQLGGSQKAGRVELEIHGAWPSIARQVQSHYEEKWRRHEGKVTFGISTYGFDVSTQEVGRLGLDLKKRLKSHGLSVRLVPNSDPALNTAASHHNKLGLSPNKVELLIVHGNSGKVIVAESIGAQNITALAARDQARPRTDAFVGMLPPKLARMMVNMISAQLPSPSDGQRRVVLDPFCGTGVVLQEALLLGYNVYGSDRSEKMVDYSTQNLDWLASKYGSLPHYRVELADAMTHQWLPPIDAVVSETYLGQPFSAPPKPEKLKEVQRNCDHIVSAFLENISRQLAPGTPLCLAVPAWRDQQNHFAHLPLTRRLPELGYELTKLTHVAPHELLYYRPEQVVARELLLLKKA
jgi:tRNA G10  N-methylase Trm11